MRWFVASWCVIYETIIIYNGLRGKPGFQPSATRSNQDFQVCASLADRHLKPSATLNEARSRTERGLKLSAISKRARSQTERDAKPSKISSQVRSQTEREVDFSQSRVWVCAILCRIGWYLTKKFKLGEFKITVWYFFNLFRSILFGRNYWTPSKLP